jgi:hypothetical protein
MTFKPLRSSAPVTSILNSEFTYRNAAQTNVADTFERVRQRMRAAEKPSPGNVARLAVLKARAK